jgi:hypothetical protein
MMRVVAIKTGFYDNSLRRQGTEFEVPEGAKSTWFIPKDADKVVIQETQEQPRTYSEMNGSPRISGPSMPRPKRSKGKAETEME